MEIDLTSIIIGITALSTFFIPIGMHQFSQNKKTQKTRKAFDSAAQKNGLQIDQKEILRNGSAIGIDSLQEVLLLLKNENETLMNLKNVAGCKLYKHQRKDTAADGSIAVIHENGIQMTFKNKKNRDIKLLLFYGKEGSTFGDESIIIERWIGKINSILKKTSSEIVH